MNDPSSDADLPFPSLPSLISMFTQLPMDSIENMAPGIARRLTRLSRKKTVAIYSGLLLSREFRSNCMCLEALIYLTLAKAKGKKAPSFNDVSACFNLLRRSQFGISEDPAEDVMVSNIIWEGENYRIVVGIWESAGFYLQRALEAFDLISHKHEFKYLRNSIRALLRISDIVCNRAGLQRNDIGNELPLGSFPSWDINSLKVVAKLTQFTSTDLDELNISIEDLSPFVLNKNSFTSLLKANLGNSDLEKYPIILSGTSVLLALPTAISVAIRRLIVEHAIETNNPHLFEGYLINSYGKLFTQRRILGATIPTNMSFTRAGPFYVTECTHVIDIDKHIHFIFLIDGLDNYQKTRWFGPPPIDIDAAEHIISNVPSRAKEASGGGMTLIVHCGWGREFLLDFKRNEIKSWRVEIIRASDLMTMNNSGEISGLNLYRLIIAKEILESENIHLYNINGLLNLFTWARNNDYHLVPHSSLPRDVDTEEARLIVEVEQNALLRLRHETAFGADIHVVQSHDGQPLVVIQKLSQWELLGNDRKSIYIPYEVRPKGELLSAYIADNVNIWCEVIDTSSRNLALQHRLWEAISDWISYVAPLIVDSCGDIPSGSIFWTIDMSNLEVPVNEPSQEEVALAPHCINTIIDSDTYKIVTTLDLGFMHGFYDSNNTAEALLVADFIKAYYKLADKEKDFMAQEQNILQRAIPNKDVRHIHSFKPTNFLDHVTTSIPQDVKFINKVENATTSIGLGWKVRKRSEGGLIEGIDNCRKYLNTIVDTIFQELTSKLNGLNREMTIRLMLMNHEASEVDMLTWIRTSRALISLHEDHDGMSSEINHRLTLLDNVRTVSRISIEAALCECPLLGGNIPSQTDIDWINVRSSLLFRFGNTSDAIKYRAEEPRILISPAGEILFGVEFQDSIVVPLINTYRSSIVNMAVDNYEQYYEDIQERHTILTDMEKSSEFSEALVAEFGLSYDQLLQIYRAILELGLDLGQGVFKKTRNFLIRSLSESCDEEAVLTFIKEFSLRPRYQWSHTPSSYSERDWYPWRFSRRLSLVRRPLIQLDHTHNPSFLIAPGLIFNGIMATLIRSFNGEYHPNFFESKKMKSWRGKRANERGHSFNEKVKGELEARGWTVRKEIGLSSAIGRKLDPDDYSDDYGDIDVLAWKQEPEKAFAIECKQLNMVRADGEIARQLVKFRGELSSSDEPDDLLRHMRRIKKLDEHFSELKQNLSLPDKITSVEPYLVFSDPVPLIFVRDAKIQTKSLKQFLEFIDEIS